MEISAVSTHNSMHMTGLTALPPWAQEKREKDAILTDPRLADLLNGRTVSSIDKAQGGNRGYLVTLSDGTSLTVNVTYLRREDGFAGPAKFELNFPNSAAARPESAVRKALPPAGQEKREKEAILAELRLAKLIGNREVVNIDKTEGFNGFDRGYELTLNDGTILMVGLMYLPPENGIRGPASFELTFPGSI